MAAVLGVSAYYHDAAAALVVDGNCVAASAEERFSRVKGDAKLPLQAIDFCLTKASLLPRDLDRVVYYENPFAKLERIFRQHLQRFPRGVVQFAKTMRHQLGDKLWARDRLATLLGLPRDRVTSVAHHESHAASAFYASPFRNAAVITVDGVGEETTSAIWHGNDEGLLQRWQQGLPNSLGLFYSAITAYCGFEVLFGECKVMGLAAYGTPRFRDELATVLTPAAPFRVDARFIDATGDSAVAYTSKLLDLLGPCRKYGRRWDLSNADDQRFADIAASAQAVLEEALLAMAHQASRLTGANKLCLAGGVALNCRANARLVSEGPFDEVYVQPAASDAGGALGAAYLGAVELGDVPGPLDTLALGAEASSADAAALAKHLGLTASRVTDPAQAAANLLAEGKLVAWVQDRAEWGPRALGYRSLLAPASDRAFRDTINREIKHREDFRPFAPVVLDETFDTLFLPPGPNLLTAAMTTICTARDNAHKLLGATLHVDGTARAQTVGAHNPLASILQSLPSEQALLQTSLNGPGEPLCNSAQDGIAFMTSQPAVSALVIDDLLITRPQ